MLKLVELLITHIGFVAATLLIYEYIREKMLNTVDSILYNEFSKSVIIDEYIKT
jgi:hypothetical protein